MGTKSINLVKIKTKTNIKLKKEKIISFNKKRHNRIQWKEYFSIKKDYIKVGFAINFINSAPSNLSGSE